MVGVGISVTVGVGDGVSVSVGVGVGVGVEDGAENPATKLWHPATTGPSFKKYSSKETVLLTVLSPSLALAE